MYHLSENIRTRRYDLSTLTSARCRCFWTFLAISDGEILYVLKQFRKFTGLVGQMGLPRLLATSIPMYDFSGITGTFIPTRVY